MKSVLYICFVVSLIDLALSEQLLGARSLREVRLDGVVNDNGEVLPQPIASDSSVSESSAPAASPGDVIGGGSDVGSSADGDSTDAESPADGGSTDAESPADGDSTDAESPTDGDSTDPESPNDGGLTDPDSLDDGGSMDPENPDDGGSTDPENLDDGDSTDAESPDDGDSSAREGRDNTEESGFLQRTSSTQFLPLDEDTAALPLVEFVRHPEGVLVAAGAAAWLSCRLESGLGPVQLSWWMDGRQLQRPEENGTSTQLVLDAVQSGRDDGLYHCVADGQFGAVRSLPARVTIASLAVGFATVPGNMTVMAGDAAVFNCSIVSTPPANITWLKDQLPLSDDIVQRAVVDVTGLLAIRQLQSEDAGEYSCVAENNVAGETRHSAAGRLTVVPTDGADRAPRMLLPATSIVNVTLFSGVTLPCVASGSPAPQLQWIQVGESSVIPSAVQRPDGSLLLDRVNNHAVYKCTASNSAGQAVQERDVRVHAAPIIQPDSVLPDRRVLLVPGRLLRLECNALAVPDPPSIDWYKNGRPLVADSAGRVFQRNNTLVISNIHSGDAAMYQCLASNSLGSTLHSVQLLVDSSNTALLSPANVSASDVTAHTALISWQFPQSNTHLAYSIHYRKLNSSASEKQQVTPGSPYRLQQLDAVSQYEVYVRAYAQKGATDPSHTIIVTTGVGVPFRAPKLSVAIVNATALNASWVPLPPSLANGPVIGYSVTWQLHESQPVGYQLHSPAAAAESRSAHLSAVHHWHLITGMSPGAMYGVSVRAATRAGYGNVTADVTWVQMPSDDITASSPHLSLVATSHSTIRVLWVPPEDTAITPTGYQLTYRRRRVDSRVEDVVQLPVDARQYDLTGLAESRWYEVRLRALLLRPGAVSESVRSIRTLSSSNGSQPQPPAPDPMVEPPVQVRAEPLNATAVRVEWQPPPSAHDISYYSVQYWRLGEERSALNSLSSTDPRLAVTGLVPDSLYAFRVRSHDDTDHYGPYADASKVRTLEGVPTAPGTVVWSPLSVSSVRVSWQPPLHSHGNITVYRLLYTDQPDSPLQDWLSINSTTTHAPVCRLLANQQYSVRVQGGTAAGLGELSNITSLMIKATLDGTGHQLSPVAYGVVAGVCVLFGVLLCAALCWTLVWWRSRRRQRLRWCSRRAPLYPEGSGGWRPHTNGRVPSAPGDTRLELEPLTRPTTDRSATIVANIATTPTTNKVGSGNGNGSLLRLDPPRSSPRRSSTRVAVGDGHTRHPAAASADESYLNSSSVALINNQSVVS